MTSGTKIQAALAALNTRGLPAQSARRGGPDLFRLFSDLMEVSGEDNVYSPDGMVPVRAVNLKLLATALGVDEEFVRKSFTEAFKRGLESGDYAHSSGPYSHIVYEVV